ncbi:hypothetical protein AVEN_115510-1 [Araneus ventricosus]|uniref:Uncharacterized protein n=1 Tax=Araneus ventricosus TaxID=182803 RepID=A0A4Y2CJM7_ARAVE|nr:hypothetical protein AVEN_115510-1 [Araneus ventricosus]
MNFTEEAILKKGVRPLQIVSPREDGDERFLDAGGEARPIGARAVTSAVKGIDIAAVWALGKFLWWYFFEPYFPSLKLQSTFR